MKKLSFLIVFFVWSLTKLSAQIVNVNPDPNGEPWIAGDASMPPPEIIALIPVLELSPQSSATQLPAVVDNAQLMFMPFVFDQKNSAACVHVAELWYSFAYEINRLRNVPAGTQIGGQFKHNQYHPFYTYNFVNSGNSQLPTPYQSGFDILKQNGCPSYDIYDDPALEVDTTKYIYWMTDYDNYFSGMRNRIADYSFIYFNSNYSSFDILKHWLADHNIGSSTGGLAIIAVYINGWVTDHYYPAGTPEAGKKLVSQWGTSKGHALTIVGYNDSVRYDLNQNGVFDPDEYGAFKVANSWGTTFGNGGFIYIPYKLMTSGLQWSNTAYVCHIDTVDYEPELSIKASVEHNNRSKIKFMVGYADNASQTSPIDTSDFHSFNYQGGSYSMRGAYAGPN